MKVPLSWLQKYIDLKKSPEVISEILTLAGLEVDKIDRLHFSFSGVVFGLITQVSPHPESDDLKILEVSDGKKKFPVVSAALGLKVGLVTAFAKVGARLYNSEKGLYTVEKTKIRGAESLGMLVSGKELGISQDHTNVLKFPADSPLGEDVSKLLYDPILDITLTPNLGYCRSIIGIARELSAHLNIKLELPERDFRESIHTATSSKIRVSNEAHDSCYQYTCRIIQGVDVEESPYWLKDLIEKSGYQSINNVVDATNFVMHELGVPLHAFDYDTLVEKQITIRKAREEDTLVTLDGTLHAIPEGTLLICDGDSPIAIAGIMGGERTAISSKTHTVLLEAAQFKETSIRQSSKKLHMRTESSARFENGIDPALVRYALDRAALLIEELGKAKILQGVVEQSPKPYSPRFLTCRLSRINHLLGTTFSLSEVESYFTRLGISVSSDNQDLYQLKVPSWRSDIKEEIDLVEEVARVFGFNHIPRKKPRHITSHIPHHPLYLLENKVRSSLIAAGLQEFITCDLMSPTICDLEIENGLFNPEYIEVLHAKSVDQSILRPSLLPGLLDTIKTNQNQSNFDVQAFEIGRIHFKEGASYDEKPSLGIVLAGKASPLQWKTKSSLVDFYDLKGVIETLREILLLPPIAFEASLLKTFHPGRQARMLFDDEVFGVMGEIHPTSLEQLDIRGRVLFAEIDLLSLEKHRKKKALFTALPAYPGSERDWTVSVPRDSHLQSLFDAIKAINSPILKDVALIDIYTGDTISPLEKNISLRFFYRDETKTLDVNTVEEEHQNIIRLLQKAL